MEKIIKVPHPPLSLRYLLTMSFATSFHNRTIVSPFAARPLVSRLSEPPPYPTGFSIDLQEYDWKIALKHSPSLMSFHHEPIPLLVPVALPLTAQDVPVQLKDLERYARFHDWITKHVFCFCSLKDGRYHHVGIFTVRRKDSDNFNCVCVGCASWKPSGGGCSFFVNLERLEAIEKNFHQYARFPEIDLGKGKKRARSIPVAPTINRIQARTVASHVRRQRKPYAYSNTAAHTLPSPVSFQMDDSLYHFIGRDFSPVSQAVLSPPPSERVLAGTLENLTPGYFDDIDRLSSPAPPAQLYTRIEDLPIPSSHETNEVIMNLVLVCGSGVPFGELMKVLGRCKLCRRIIALSVLNVHICPDVTESPIAATGSISRMISSSSTASNSSPSSSSPSVHSDHATTSHSSTQFEECDGVIYESDLLPISSPYHFPDIIDLTDD
ncbi:hypothetical protein QCA50_016612 [Cerrena zonata]|uniref:Uncharacterized protein n=1 Tax=Cerrena zonata TaxID=2478898 RepID=A0AAW0FM31_9APHY